MNWPQPQYAHLRVSRHVFSLPINTCSTCRTHRLLLLFFFSPPLFFPPQARRSIKEPCFCGLPWRWLVAVCGQTLPVVVKAHTISCSAGPPSPSPPLIVVRWYSEEEREGEASGVGEINQWEQRERGRGATGRERLRRPWMEKTGEGKMER